MANNQYNVQNSSQVFSLLKRVSFTDFILTFGFLANPVHACEAPPIPRNAADEIRNYLQASDAYLTCLQQSDTPDTPPLVRKAQAKAIAATYQAMQKAVDDYNAGRSSAR